MTPEDHERRRLQAASAGKAYGEACNKEARRLTRAMFPKLNLTDKDVDSLLAWAVDPAQGVR